MSPFFSHLRRPIMLSGREMYKIWAPADSIWSPWVAPAFFAQLHCAEASSNSATAFADETALKFDPQTAIVIDLPGADSIRLAVQLARIGYRAVSSINTATGPDPFLAHLPSP